jgi:hypothetical protein
LALFGMARGKLAATPSAAHAPFFDRHQIKPSPGHFGFEKFWREKSRAFNASPPAVSAKLRLGHALLIGARASCSPLGLVHPFCP